MNSAIPRIRLPRIKDASARLESLDDVCLVVASQLAGKPTSAGDESADDSHGGNCKWKVWTHVWMPSGRRVALHDHGHTSVVRRVRDVTHHIETGRTGPTGLLGTVPWRVDARHHPLARAHRFHADTREGRIRIIGADATLDHQGDCRSEISEFHPVSLRGLCGGSLPQPISAEGAHS